MLLSFSGGLKMRYIAIIFFVHAFLSSPPVLASTVVLDFSGYVSSDTTLTFTGTQNTTPSNLTGSLFNISETFNLQNADSVSGGI
jgi:hypothetical protein